MTLSIIIGSIISSGLGTVLLFRMLNVRGCAVEARLRSTGLEPITWLLVIGGMVAATIAMIALYNQILVDQGGKIDTQDIECVCEEGGELLRGTLKEDGSCAS